VISSDSSLRVCFIGLFYLFSTFFTNKVVVGSDRVLSVRVKFATSTGSTVVGIFVANVPLGECKTIDALSNDVKAVSDVFVAK